MVSKTNHTSPHTNPSPKHTSAFTLAKFIYTNEHFTHRTDRVNYKNTSQFKVHAY